MEEKLELDRRELSMVHEAMGLYMTLKNLEVARHKMYKEESMDRLFEKMEAFADAGVVWVKIARAMGVPQEVIAEYLQEVEK